MSSTEAAPFTFTIADPSPGDMDTDGDLIEPGRFSVFAWKTKNADEHGERIDAVSPRDAGLQVTRLLRRGCYQLVVEDLRAPQRAV